MFSEEQFAQINNFLGFCKQINANIISKHFTRTYLKYVEMTSFEASALNFPGSNLLLFHAVSIEPKWAGAHIWCELRELKKWEHHDLLDLKILIDFSTRQIAKELLNLKRQ